MDPLFANTESASSTLLELVIVETYLRQYGFEPSPANYRCFISPCGRYHFFFSSFSRKYWDWEFYKKPLPGSSSSPLEFGKVEYESQLSKLNHLLGKPHYQAAARPDTREYIPYFTINPTLDYLMVVLEGVGFKCQEHINTHLAFALTDAEGEREVLVEITRWGGIIMMGYYLPGTNRKGNRSMMRQNTYNLRDDAEPAQVEMVREWLRAQGYPPLVRAHRLKILQALRHDPLDELPA